MERRFAIGAELGPEGTHFRVFAPVHQRVEVVERELGSEAPGRAHELSRDGAGYHAGLVRGLGAGRAYSFRLADDRTLYPDPADPETFAKCKLDPLELARNARALAFHGELLRLRRDDPVFSSQRARLDGACLGSSAFLLRYRAEEGERLVVVNLGPDLLPASLAEPLLAPPAGTTWRLIFASEDPRYGGEGQRTPHEQGRWALTASSASVFAAQSVPPSDER